MLKMLSEVDVGASFQPKWCGRSPDVISENGQLGSLIHVVVAEVDGRPLYDSPLWLERTGAIGVPIDQDGKLVLLQNYRRVPCAPKRLGEIPFTNLSECGRCSLELPRGFPERGEDPALTALREVEEETGYAAAAPVYLGATNTNTTFFPFCNQIFAVSVDTRRPRKTVEEINERIEGVVVLSWEDVLRRVVRDEIFCGMTKSALLNYAAWKAAESNLNSRA